MPTTVTKTIKPSGGDYTSASAWEAGQNGNLVGGDTLQVGEAYSMSDTTAFTVDGGTTDATRYMVLRTPASERSATGIFDTSKYYFHMNGTTVVTVNDDYFRMDGIQIEDYGTAGYHNFVDFRGGNYFRFTAGIIRKTVADLGVHNAFYTNTGGNTAYIINTLVYDMGRFSYDDSGPGAYVYYYNCGAYNVTSGNGAFHSWGSRGVAKNCWAQGCTDGFVGNWDTTNSQYNCSDIASDAPGSNSQTGNITFTNAAGGDFSLASGDTKAKDLGTDLSGDAILPFATDIISVTRSDTWDIGPFAYITAGGGANWLKQGYWWNRVYGNYAGGA